jgi:hypothetical protein
MNQLQLCLLYRDDWKKQYSRKTKKWEMPNDVISTTFVKSHQDTIEKIILQIKTLDKMPQNDQIIALDKLYPPAYTLHNIDDIQNDLINSLM